ncbi:MAG TPA: VWA domain-containing protein [Candidatus Acidoferrales bacterium]|nr:VWA domain-containing protein [Candidatus Acidoferrales bacterium]
MEKCPQSRIEWKDPGYRGWSSGRALSVSVAAVAFALLALSSTAQRLSPGEVRISISPYPAPSPTVRVASRMVYVRVVVRNSDGQPVAGLTKSDFVVFDSGHQRQLTTFSVERLNSKRATPRSKGTGAPPSGALKPTLAPQQPHGPGRWVLLFFDDINTPSGDLARAKIAANHFIEEAAASGSRVGIFTASAGQILPFSSNAREMLKSLATIASHPRMSAAAGFSCPRITPLQAYRIAHGDVESLDAKVTEACSCSGYPPCVLPNQTNVVELAPQSGIEAGKSPAATEVRMKAQEIWNQARVVAQTTLGTISSAVGQLAPVPGQRVLLFASSGFLSGVGLEAQVNEIINEALRTGVVVDSLDSKGLVSLAPGRPINEPPQPVPVQTIIYEAQTLDDKLDSEDEAMANLAESTGGILFRNNNDLDFGFRELGLAPAISYVLGFRPEEDGKYHKIKVKVSDARHDLIQARPGYFAPAKEAKNVSGPTPQDKIDREVRSSNLRSDFPLTVSDTHAQNGSGKLTILAHVGIAKLPFETHRGRHVEELTFVGALFDARGKLVTGKEAHMVFAFKRQTFERFGKTGIGAVMTLDASPGNYRLRVVVAEPVRGETSATSRRVQIP